MSTPKEVSAKALRRLGLYPPEADIPSPDLASATEALYRLIASWETHGVTVSPDVPLPLRHETGIIALLAVHVAPEYGASATITPQIQKEASDGWIGLQAAYIMAPNAKFDSAIIRTMTRDQQGTIISPPSPVVATDFDEW